MKFCKNLNGLFLFALTALVISCNNTDETEAPVIKPKLKFTSTWLDDDSTALAENEYKRLCALLTSHDTSLAAFHLYYDSLTSKPAYFNKAAVISVIHSRLFWENLEKSDSVLRNASEVENVNQKLRPLLMNPDTAIVKMVCYTYTTPFMSVYHLQKNGKLISYGLEGIHYVDYQLRHDTLTVFWKYRTTVHVRTGDEFTPFTKGHPIKIMAGI